MNHIGVASQLRLIADLLDRGEMSTSGGKISVTADARGKVSIMSDLQIACHEQPSVEQVTTGAQDTTSRIAIYQSLERMQIGEVAHLNFDYDEKQSCDEWVQIIRNRSAYPKELIGSVFDVYVRNFPSSINVKVERLV